MGYYIEIIESNFSMKAENFDKAYKVVCELNANDNMKSSGRFGGEPTVKPANSKSVSDNPDKWFSFMPWDYDETCKDIIEVLETLGFEVYCSDNEIESLYYYGKCGQEDIFLEAIAPFVESGSYLLWRGEDNTMWVHEFEDGEMIEKSAYITW